MSVTLNPNLLAELNRRHKELMTEVASEGADILQENLSSPSHGSGVHYPRLPNRSSAPGEMPVMQSGDLARGVTSEDDTSSPTGAKVVIEDSLGKLLGLEFSPPSTNPNQPGTPSRDSGGRAPMWETMSDERTHQAMRDRVRRS